MLPKDNHCSYFYGFPSSFFTVYTYAFPHTENVQNYNLTVYKIVCLYFVLLTIF